MGGGTGRGLQLQAQGAGDDTAFKPYAKVEGTFTLLGSAEAGLGARYSGDEVQPYATASFPVAPRIRIKANAGRDYYALGLRADF